MGLNNNNSSSSAYQMQGRKGRHKVVTAKLACFLPLPLPRAPACRTAMSVDGPMRLGTSVCPLQQQYVICPASPDPL